MKFEENPYFWEGATVELPPVVESINLIEVSKFNLLDPQNTFLELRLLGLQALQSIYPQFFDWAAARGILRETPKYQIYREIMEDLAPKIRRGGEPSYWLDLGCGDFSYARVIRELFPATRLIGVDIDPIQIAKARTNSTELSDVEFQCGDFAEFKLPADFKKSFFVLSFFFPYVEPNACVKGELPKRFSNFAGTLKKILKKFPSDHPGMLVSVHQGEWEYEIAKRVLGSFGIIERSLHLGALIQPRAFPHEIGIVAVELRELDSIHYRTQV